MHQELCTVAVVKSTSVETVFTPRSLLLRLFLNICIACKCSWLGLALSTTSTAATLPYLRHVRWSSRGLGADSAPTFGRPDQRHCPGNTAVTCSDAYKTSPKPQTLNPLPLLARRCVGFQRTQTVCAAWPARERCDSLRHGGKGCTGWCQHLRLCLNRT